jgi:cation diffusion facilitator CzcD-associated flavoprotein CzcO
MLSSQKMPQTITECIEILAYNDHFWEGFSPHHKDRKTITSLAQSDYAWTEKQAKLGLIIVKRYKSLFEKYDLNITNLCDNPIWRDKFRKIDYEKVLEKYINDDVLRQHMIPNYELGCRRVIPTNSFLPALSRENVDVDISGIESITSTGIKTKEGKDIPLDIIVYATGFYAYSNMKRSLSFQVYGIGGRNLNSEWETEIVPYKGITVSGYPNYFKVNGPNTGTGHSSQLCYMEVMTDYTVKAICAIKRDKSIKAIDVKKNLQAEYVAKVKKNLKLTVWQNSNCKAFYRKNMTGVVTSLSPEPVVTFIFSRKWFRLSDFNLLKK